LWVRRCGVGWGGLKKKKWPDKNGERGEKDVKGGKAIWSAHKDNGTMVKEGKREKRVSQKQVTKNQKKKKKKGLRGIGGNVQTQRRGNVQAKKRERTVVGMGPGNLGRGVTGLENANKRAKPKGKLNKVISGGYGMGKSGGKKEAGPPNKLSGFENVPGRG